MAHLNHLTATFLGLLRHLPRLEGARAAEESTDTRGGGPRLDISGLNDRTPSSGGEAPPLKVRRRH